MNVTNLALYPCVMGIINVTPDSFHAASRVSEESMLCKRVTQILDEGGLILDIGACSTRPGSPSVSEAEEIARLDMALPVVASSVEAWVQQHPDHERPTVSVDTFRANVAEHCIEKWHVDIINDISGGTIEPRILEVVARTHTPYILMHMRGTPETMQQLTDYPDGVTQAVSDFFAQQLARLDEACQHVGATHRPMVILDPGFGFAKTLDQNYELMQGLERLMADYPDMLMLVGVSRKSMIQRAIGVDADNALNGTTVLNTYALMHGVHILRVHDVREAVEAVQLCSKMSSF